MAVGRDRFDSIGAFMQAASAAQSHRDSHKMQNTAVSGKDHADSDK